MRSIHKKQEMVCSMSSWGSNYRRGPPDGAIFPEEYEGVEWETVCRVFVRLPASVYEAHGEEDVNHGRLARIVGGEHRGRRAVYLERLGRKHQLLLMGEIHVMDTVVKLTRGLFEIRGDNLGYYQYEEGVCLSWADGPGRSTMLDPEFSLLRSVASAEYWRGSLEAKESDEEMSADRGDPQRVVPVSMRATLYETVQSIVRHGYVSLPECVIEWIRERVEVLVAQQREAGRMMDG